MQKVQNDILPKARLFYVLSMITYQFNQQVFWILSFSRPGVTGHPALPHLFLTTISSYLATLLTSGTFHVLQE